jgi:hypothetical protein
VAVAVGVVGWQWQWREWIGFVIPSILIGDKFKIGGKCSGSGSCSGRVAVAVAGVAVEWLDE